MARRRIFARRRTPRWPLAALLSLALVGLASAGGVAFLRSSFDGIPACSAAEVRHELNDLLREHPDLSEASELQVVELDERKQVFRRDRMLARDCAATAEVDGARELIRFRIMPDGEQGYVLSLRGV
jgi:hypothetical protein